jgi:hypothetical protein
MTRHLARRALLCTLLVLGGCAAPGPSAYGPLLGRFGYEQKKLDDATWRVAFTANRFTPRDRAESYALYRAAELALANGFSRFAVMDRNFDRHTERTYADRAFPPGFESPESRVSGSGHPDRFESSRLVVNEWLSAVLVVHPYRDKAPAGAIRVYDARAELDRLRPSLKRR